MSTRANSDARLNFRLPNELKEIIEQAAGQLGQSISEFAVSTLVRTAHDVLEQHNRTTLSQRDYDLFIRTLDDKDAKPNADLIEAARDCRTQVEHR